MSPAAQGLLAQAEGLTRLLVGWLFGVPVAPTPTAAICTFH